jgi:hypothetical protein
VTDGRAPPGADEEARGASTAANQTESNGLAGADDRNSESLPDRGPGAQQAPADEERDAPSSAEEEPSSSAQDEKEPMGSLPADPRPFFSFFVTSQAGLFGLPAGEVAPAPDPALGYGGNFGGLAGADEICTRLAQQSNANDAKTWRAFLSTSGFDGGERVDAIDRIGEGPWYDHNGRLFAETRADLMPQGNDGRPRGAVPQLAAMFTDENGDDSRPSRQIDNHDTLTGSGVDGRLYDDGRSGRVATCEDWTSNTLRGDQGNPLGFGGQVPVGHSWPRNNVNGRHWISEHTVNGCEPGFDTDGGAGAPLGDFRVGAGGGYGGIYCFALGAVPPSD